MSLEKREPYRNQKLLDIARDMPCMNCGAMDGTTVLAHYQGIRAYALGKGKSQKPDDDCGAFLCGKCHKRFDSYENSAGALKDQSVAIDRSEQFLFCVVRTMNLLHRIGFDFTVRKTRFSALEPGEIVMMDDNERIYGK